MTEHMNTYCPECDKEVSACLHSQLSSLYVRGELVTYSETVAICPECGTAIGDSRIEDANLEGAYAVYRSLHGILSPAEIKELRQSYGLSLREFSKFLGFGEQTTYRYEHGDIPDQPHNTTMLSARSVEGAHLLLSQNSSRLSGRSKARVEQHIQEMADGTARDIRFSLALAKQEDDAPTAANGYRRLDMERVAALAFELATRCHDLYWTKFQKAMFFADMVGFERDSRSLTGLSYAHATYGPVMDDKDEIRHLLVQRGAVGFCECGWGEVLVPLQAEGQPFSPMELAIIAEVATFVDSFGSASELSDFSHGLSCWKTSADGDIIDYTRTDGEVGRAMAGRLAQLATA